MDIAEANNMKAVSNRFLTVVFMWLMAGLIFVVIVLAVSATDLNGNSGTSTSIESTVINGDVNGDGTVNLGDGIYLAKHALLVQGHEDIEEAVSDVNGDGIVNLNDAIYLINHALKVPGYGILH